MSTPNDGGPAFPTVPKNHGYDESQGTGSGPGMSLRAWYAGQALNGYLAGRNNGGLVDSRCEQVAKACVAYADAVIKELGA